MEIVQQSMQQRSTDIADVRDRLRSVGAQLETLEEHAEVFEACFDKLIEFLTSEGRSIAAERMRLPIDNRDEHLRLEGEWRHSERLCMQRDELGRRREELLLKQRQLENKYTELMSDQ